MKNTRYLAGSLVLLFGFATPLFALANSVTALAPVTAAQPFAAFCGPYQTPFTEGGFYTPNETGGCEYDLPAPTASFRIVEIYKGTPGNAAVVDSGFAQVPYTVLDSSPNIFNGTQGDAFFFAAYDVNTQAQLTAAENYLQFGGTAPGDVSINTLSWKYGVESGAVDNIPPTVTINTPADGSTYHPGDTVFIDADGSDNVGITTVTYTLNGMSVDPGQPLPLSSQPLGPAILVIAAGDAAGNVGYATSTFIIAQNKQTITFDALSDKTYGDPGFMVQAQASSNLPVNFSAEGNCTVSDTVVTITGAGSCTVTAHQAGTSTFDPAPDVSQTFNIGKAPLTVTAQNASMTLGGTIPPLSAVVSGFVYNDTAASVTGGASCSTTATSASLAGTYPITCTIGTLTSNNYSFGAFLPATLVVSYRWDGFLQPINDTAHQVGLNTSVFKGGSTVPVKFQLKKADGTVVQAAAAPQWLTPIKLGPMSSTVDESTYTDTPTSGNSFKWDGSQYQYNWSTKGFTAGFWYQITAKADDGEVFWVIIGLR